MRCPDCNKFVSYDDPEVEVSSEEVERVDSNTVRVTAEVAVSLNCADCGTQLKQADLTYEEDHNVPLAEDVGDDYEDDLSVSIEAEPLDRYATEDRHGKPIRNPRYQTHYYGANLSITITSDGLDMVVSGSVEEAASGFEEVA